MENNKFSFILLQESSKALPAEKEGGGRLSVSI
jgi:hypothetical protein